MLPTDASWLMFLEPAVGLFDRSWPRRLDKDKIAAYRSRNKLVYG